jgi:pimeloyl-ACP methyl ester carboxylesterase
MLKTSIHFASANGFPAQCYKYIFSQLANTRVQYINTLAHNVYADPNSQSLWHHMADEIIDNIIKNNHGPVIGIGHSCGGTATYLASIKRPDLFKQLILIEPIVLKTTVNIFLSLLHHLNLSHRVPLAQQALQRKTKFESKQEARTYFEEKPFFKTFDEKSLDAYIEHGLTQEDDHFTLTFSKQVEADIFSIGKQFHKPKKNPIPITCIFGENSDLLLLMDTKWWKKLNNTNVIYRPCGHMMPFEEPSQFLKLISNLIHR